MALLWRLCKRGHPQTPKNIKFHIYQRVVRKQCRVCHQIMHKERLRRERAKQPKYVLRTDWSMRRE